MKGGLINFLAFSSGPSAAAAFSADSWVADVPGDEVAALFHDWEPDVRSLVQVISSAWVSLLYQPTPAFLKCIPTAKRWAVHVVESLPTTVFQHVALLGDAVSFSKSFSFIPYLILMVQGPRNDYTYGRRSGTGH